MILFVASNPSHLNFDSDIPIVGSRSEKNFNKWVKFLVPDGKYKVINAADIVTTDNRPLTRGEVIGELPELIKKIDEIKPTKVIALGNTAAGALDLTTDYLGIFQYFKLPHPSPRNLKINNKEQLNTILEECKSWLQRIHH